MTHSLTEGTEYYGLNEVFTNYFSSLFKKTNNKPSPPPTKNRKPVDYVFLQFPGDSLQRASLQPLARQAPCPRSVSSSAGLGPGS